MSWLGGSATSDLERRVAQLEQNLEQLRNRGPGDNLVPNPPFLQLMEQNAASVRSELNVPELGVDVPELGGTLLDAAINLAEWNVTDSKAIPGTNQVMSRPARWFIAANQVTGGGITWFNPALNTIDYDPENNLAEQSGVCYAFRTPAAGYYRMEFHALTLPPTGDLVACGWGYVGSADPISQGNQTYGSGSVVSLEALDTRYLGAGYLLAAFLYQPSAASGMTVYGDANGKLTYATVQRVA